MTLITRPTAVSPEAEVAQLELRRYLKRSDLTDFEFPPPVAIVASVTRAWQREGGGEEGFIPFVNTLLAGTGWVADDDVTAYLGDDKSPCARIVLHRDI